MLLHFCVVLLGGALADVLAEIDYPSWVRLVRSLAAMDAVVNPMPRDLRQEESLTCTFVIFGRSTPHTRPAATTPSRTRN